MSACVKKDVLISKLQIHNVMGPKKQNKKKQFKFLTPAVQLNYPQSTAYFSRKPNPTSGVYDLLFATLSVKHFTPFIRY